MKSKLAVVALALLLSAPAFAKGRNACEPLMCGNSAVGTPAAGQSAAYPPGPTIWSVMLQMFGL
jgi:hypothetical protein